MARTFSVILALLVFAVGSGVVERLHVSVDHPPRQEGVSSCAAGHGDTRVQATEDDPCAVCAFLHAVMPWPEPADIDLALTRSSEPAPELSASDPPRLPGTRLACRGPPLG